MAVEVLRHAEMAVNRTPNVLAREFVKLLKLAEPFLALTVAAFVISRVLNRNKNKKA